MGKSLFASKTFWFNALTAASSVLAVLAGSPLIAEHPKLVAAVGIAVGIVNIGLRIVTDEPINGSSR